MAINKRKDEFAKHITRICDDRGNKALEELKQQIKDKEKAKKKDRDNTEEYRGGRI